MTGHWAYGAGLLALFIVCSSQAWAAEFRVTTEADTADGRCDQHCSLREAILAANAQPGPDIVRIPPGYFTLERDGAGEDRALTGDLDIIEDVVLLGSREGMTVVDGNFLDRVLQVHANARAEVHDLRLRNGLAARQGGGIHNAGELLLNRVWVSENQVVNDGSRVLQGGGIYNSGSLHVFGTSDGAPASRIEQNVAVDGERSVGGYGAGIFNTAGAHLTLQEAVILGNESGAERIEGMGAGLFNLGTALIERSYFAWNLPGSGEGAAIANRDGGQLTVRDSIITDNGSAGAQGAISNGGGRERWRTRSALRLVNVTLADNPAGAVVNRGRMKVENLLVAGGGRLASTHRHSP